MPLRLLHFSDDKLDAHVGSTLATLFYVVTIVPHPCQLY